MPPEPIYPREVNLSDLQSQYTEGIETFRQVLGSPDPKNTSSVYFSHAPELGTTTVESQTQRPIYLPAPTNATLKDEQLKLEQDF